MPKVIIDGTEYEVREGRNMLEAALDNGLDLPYFCWHPAMGSVGACRLCAVRVYKDQNDTKGKIMMACMTPAKDGTRISMNDPEAAELRRYVIEWLMTNHPHDCPVCDEGGECHLQDMTTMCGQVYRRFRFKKRTYNNQNLGPMVNHELNRCIQCYRCVRYYRDLAGGRDLNVFGCHNNVYFGRQEDGVLESEFSGNLVEICPTGVFTDKTYDKHYTRKWDLSSAPSVCVHCGLGCNTLPNERYGMLRRITSRYNGEVNGYFLCDRGRYGYEFVNQSTVDSRQSTVGEVLDKARKMLANAKGVVGIGSPRASLEANYALKKLVGEGNFSNGLSTLDHDCAELALKILTDGPARTPSLAEVEKADVVLVLGADPTNEAPMLDFAIRQAMRKAPLDIARKLKIPDWDANAVKNALQDAKGSLYVAAPWQIKIEEICGEHFHGSPNEVAEFGARVNDTLRSGWGEEDSLASHIARDLTEAHQPLIVTSISAGFEMIRTAANIVWALREQGKDAWLTIIVPEVNTMGAAMLGGSSVQDALAKIESGDADTLIVLENDLSRRMNPDELESALGKVKNLIALDCIATQITDRADVLIPSPAWVETDGTFINNECRAQRFYQVYVPEIDLSPALPEPGRELSPPSASEGVRGRSPEEPVWKSLQQIGIEAQWETFEDVLSDLADDIPTLAPVLEAGASPDWKSRAGQKYPRLPHRFSGRTAKDANKTVFEPQPPADDSTPFAFTMEGDQNVTPGPLAQRFWYPGWNSEAAINKFQIEVGGGMHGGPGGKRLIEPSNRPAQQFTDTTIAPAGNNEVWIVPRPRIFGSEELSRHAPAIAELTPPAEAVVHPNLAEKHGITDGTIIKIILYRLETTLPVRVDDSVADGVVSVPAQFAETMGILGSAKASIEVVK